MTRTINEIIFSSAIDVNEKSEIKQLLLAESFLEPIPQIAIQTAVLIGNIARLDYPREWNEVSCPMKQSNLWWNSNLMIFHTADAPFEWNN